MSKSLNTPWGNEWQLVQPLSIGGQGTTTIVREVSTGRHAVLKKLNRQTDPERRRRMHREVTVLQTLDHSGIPRLLQSNSHRFAGEEHLYLITELIPGDTLGEYIARNVLSVKDACDLLLKLLAVVEYTHKSGVVHRDIKPDNIILRNSLASDPVLIDFGLSFNEAEEAGSSLTDSLQQLGNRFLTLPELQLKTPAQRDPRSDLTQLVGILFFAIAGVFPVALADESSRLPHQRENTRHLFADIPPTTRQRVRRIFDRGFSIAIDLRWQSAAELRQAVEAVHEQSVIAQETELADVGRRLSETHDFARLKAVEEHANAVLQAYKVAFDNVRGQLGEDFLTVQTGYQIDWNNLSFGNSLGVKHRFLGHVVYTPRLAGYVIGNEIVVCCRSDKQDVEVIRFSIDGDADLGDMIEAVQAFYRQGMGQLLWELP